jgi:hypothetical protein
MRNIFIFFLLLFFTSCRTYVNSILVREPITKGNGLTGSEFYEKVVTLNWKERDSLAVEALLAGNVPDFNRRYTRINTSIVDSSTGKTIHAYYYVTNDYLSIGTSKDWARIPLTPMAAQKIADAWHSFLPTKKIVDDIYRSAKVKLEPIPMTTFRDSSITMYEHHKLIETQRNGRRGLIAGIKKDVVISSKITRDPKPDRVAIYGWHKPDGKPIQPLYTGHVNWYVDYSHGIRLVAQSIVVEGKVMNYKDVLADPVFHQLICDETDCSFYRY